jgi:hypothetical protein
MLAMKEQLLRWQEAAVEDGKVDLPFGEKIFRLQGAGSLIARLVATP